MTPFSGVTSQQAWWQVEYIGPFPSQRGQPFVLLEWILILIMDFCFQHVIMLLPTLPSMDLQNTLSATMVFHTALLLTKEPTSQPEKSDRGPMEFIAAISCYFVGSSFFYPSFLLPSQPLTLDKRLKRIERKGKRSLDKVRDPKEGDLIISHRIVKTVCSCKVKAPLHPTSK